MPELAKIAELLTEERSTAESDGDTFSPTEVDAGNPFPSTQKESDLATVYLKPEAKTVEKTKIISEYPENFKHNRNRFYWFYVRNN